MTKKQKLLGKVKGFSLNIRMSEALKVAREIGFINEGGAGSHVTLSREGEPVQLNFQPTKNGRVKPYQLRQLREMVLKYEDEQSEQ